MSASPTCCCRELLSLMQRVAMDVEAIKRQRTSAPTHHADVTLCAAVYDGIGAVSVVADDLVARAKSGNDPLLRAAIGEQVLSAGKPAQALGQRLAALHRHGNVGGFVVRRSKRTADGVLWSVERT